MTLPKLLDISTSSSAASIALPASPCSGACSGMNSGRSKRAARSGSGFVPAGAVPGNRTATLLGPVRSGPPTAGPKDSSVRDRTGPDRVHPESPPPSPPPWPPPSSSLEAVPVRSAACQLDGRNHREPQQFVASASSSPTPAATRPHPIRCLSSSASSLW